MIFPDEALLGQNKYERIEHDFYETPAWCTEVLLRHIILGPLVLEPAAGNGAISKVLKNRGISVMSYDIVQRDYPLNGVGDFLQSHNIHYDIVTNPPYALAEEFIRHALKYTKEMNGMVAMLLRNEFDCASSRKDLFTLLPFVLKIVLTKRPKWIAGSSGSPRHNYAWYVWDWRGAKEAKIVYDQ